VALPAGKSQEDAHHENCRSDTGLDANKRVGFVARPPRTIAFFHNTVSPGLPLRSQQPPFDRGVWRIQKEAVSNCLDPGSSSGTLGNVLDGTTNPSTTAGTGIVEHRDTGKASRLLDVCEQWVVPSGKQADIGADRQRRIRRILVCRRGQAAF
jgi:hypothetical protein